jgi:hypothetical protein
MVAVSDIAAARFRHGVLASRQRRCPSRRWGQRTASRSRGAPAVNARRTLQGGGRAGHPLGAGRDPGRDAAQPPPGSGKGSRSRSKRDRDASAADSGPTQAMRWSNSPAFAPFRKAANSALVKPSVVRSAVAVVEYSLLS